VLKYVCLVRAYEFKESELPFYTRCCYVELYRYPKFYLEMDVVDMLGQPELLESYHFPYEFNEEMNCMICLGKTKMICPSTLKTRRNFMTYSSIRLECFVSLASC